MSLIAGNTSSGAPGVPAEESVASAGTHLKGRIFAAGASLALSLAFLVGGFSLALGQDELVAASLAMGTFLVITVIAFFAEVIVEPSLERVAQQREERRIEAERESLPSAGGLLSSRLALTGGLDPTHPNVANARTSEQIHTAAPSGVIGAPRGRRLDITLPEETTGGPEGRASGARSPGGSEGGALRSVPEGDNAARGSGAGEGARAGGGEGRRGPVPGQRPPTAPPASEEGFQDLASLLKESSQPSPVPVRQRQ